MDVEAILLRPASHALGLTVPVLQFLIAFIATLPVSWGWRLLPKYSPRIRHSYAAITGAVLSHYALPGTDLLLLVPIAISYSSMLLWRSRCGVITFVLAFGFLLGCHVHFMSGETWKKGGIDGTGALMVLTLKVISGAMNYQDGLLEEGIENLRTTEKEYRICTLPSPLTYLGYCLNCGTHLAGPVFELKDYIDWTENKNIWSSEVEAPYVLPSLQAMARSLLCMGIYMILGPHFTPTKGFYDFPSSKSVQQWPLWKFFGYLWMCGFTARWKFYFIWSISEASLIMSGGLVQLVATQVVTAAWHGLYVGYLLFFVHSALMIAGARVIYKWQVWMNSELGSNFPHNSYSWQRKLRFSPRWRLLRMGKQALGWMIGFSYASFVLHYSWAGFLLLNFQDTLAAYRSIYYAGTALPILVIFLGNLVKPPGSSKPQVNEKAG